MRRRARVSPSALPGTDGVAKVSPCDASKRRSDVIQVEKITEHDFGTQPLEPLRPVVLSMGQGSDRVPAGQHLLSGCPASVPGRSGDQKCSPTHAWLPPELKPPGAAAPALLTSKAI